MEQQWYGLTEISAKEGNGNLTDYSHTDPGHKYGMKIFLFLSQLVSDVYHLYTSLWFDFADECCFWCIFCKNLACSFANPHICRWLGEGKDCFIQSFVM